MALLSLTQETADLYPSALAPMSTLRDVAPPPVPPAVLRRLARDEHHAELRALESLLLARTQYAQRHGLSYVDPVTGLYRRNLYTALGYNEVLDIRDYRPRYERGGIAKRIIDAYPRGTWSGDAWVQEDPDQKVSTPFEEECEALFQRLHIWSRLLRADTLAQLGRYSVVLIGAPGELDTPLPRVTGPDQILYFTPLPEDRAPVLSLVSDTADPRFGLPEFYELTLSTPSVGLLGSRISGDAQSVPSIVKRTHWSRVLHIAEGALEDDVYGTPRLQATWNYLDDADKLVGGGSEAGWRRMDPGTQYDMDPTVSAGLTTAERTALETALKDKIEEMRHGLSRDVFTRGVKATQLTAGVANFGPNTETVLSLIAGTTGIPQRILVGSERGELSSTQDRDNWSDRIMERRKELAVPLVLDLVKRLVDIGALRLADNKLNSIEVKWPEIEELNEQEKSTVVSAIASANAAQVTAGDTLIMTSDEIRSEILGLEKLSIAAPEVVQAHADKKAQDAAAKLASEAAKKAQAEAAEKGGPVAVGLAGVDADEDGADLLTSDPDLARQSSRLDRAFLAAFNSAKSSVDLSELESALVSGNRERVEYLLTSAMVGFGDRLDAELPARVVAAVAATAPIRTIAEAEDVESAEHVYLRGVEP